MKRKTYWYLFYHLYCPVCGRETTFKVRIYRRPKPKNAKKRHLVYQDYDWCDVYYGD